MLIETCDVIVMGCGGFGSAAMYHLAARGLKVIGIDRFHPPHDRGSSHGETRIIRKAYFEHPNYVPLLHRAWDLWEELAESSGERLIERRDLLLSGPPGSEVTTGARQSAQLHRLPLEVLTSEEGQRRFPMFRIPADHSLIVESTAGFLWAEKCVAAHLRLAIQHGAQLHTDEVVQIIDGTASGLSVKTSRTTYSAAAGVITCGAWTGELLPEYSKLISVKRKTLFWYPAQSADWTKAGGAPMFFIDLPEGQFYGLPSVDGQTIKVGEHTGGEFIKDPSQLARDIRAEDERPVRQFVANHLLEIDTTAREAAVCMYSMSPDGHFLFNRIPDLPLVVGGGFSGHGFKFTSVLGQAAADLIQHSTSSLDIQFLSALRFSGR